MINYNYNYLWGFMIPVNGKIPIFIVLVNKKSEIRVQNIILW